VKVLAVLSVILLVYAYGLSEVKNVTFDKAATLVDKMTPGVEEETNLMSAGSAIYHLNCTNCHGKDGEKMKSGSPKLTESKLSKEAMIDRIKNGKNAMPAYEGMLSERQIEAVAEYVGSLKEN
jgi:mono/diheme cytochrome c family protein